MSDKFNVETALMWGFTYFIFVATTVIALSCIIIIIELFSPCS